MNKLLFDRMLIVNSVGGTVSETANPNTFAMCCIGHAVPCDAMLKKQGVKFERNGIIFSFAPVFEPHVTEITEKSETSRIVKFDRNVGEYVWQMVGENDEDMELWQEVVEAVEERVIQGILGDVRPLQVTVQWVDQELHISWRNK